jgi:acetyl-CoA carboxylase carboxyl transferase subunit alpha
MVPNPAPAARAAPRMTQTNSSQYTGTYELEFERPLVAMQQQIADLESHADDQGLDIAAELRRLRQTHTATLRKLYAGLSPWNIVKVARHPGRPQTVDYLRLLVKDFCELHGDRAYGDDPAILTGFGRIGAHKCLIVGHNKGKETRERLACHFGCAHPEGYRKALRAMKLAEKFSLPVISLVDTPGAYPGMGAEERGQAHAIAVNLREMSRLKTPIITVVIGEGGSGGALGIAVADRVAMLQYAWYSVISPEGCAAILFKTGEEAARAAEALKLTAQDNLRLGLIDEIIEEPLGGAHRQPDQAAERVEKWLLQQIKDLRRTKVDKLLEKRFERYRNVGNGG